MPTECSADRLEFAPVEGRAVVAGVRRRGDHLGCRGAAAWAPPTGRSAWSGGSPPALPITASPEQVEHGLATLVGQRVFALALGYEDLVDHDTLRHDPVLAAVTGKLSRASRRLRAAGRQVDPQPARARAGRGADALPQDRPRRGRDRAAVRRAVPRRAQHAARGDRARPGRHRRPAARPPGGPLLPRLLWLLLLPAALRLLRRSPAGRPSCGGRTSTPAPARSRRSRGSWRRSAPAGRRCGSSCAPTAASPATELMAWCRAAPGRLRPRPGPQPRLVGAIAAELAAARAEAERTGKPARCFKDFRYQTLDSWSCERRVVGKAEQLVDGGGETEPQPALRGHLARRRGLGAASHSTSSSTAPAARWRTGSRSASSTCSPTAPRPGPCGPTSSACGSPSMAYVLLAALRRIAPAGHPARPGHRRHDPPQAAQDRRPGARLGPPGHGRHGLRPPLAARLGHRPPSPHRGGRLTTTQTAHSRHHSTRRCPRVAADRADQSLASPTPPPAQACRAAQPRSGCRRNWRR